MNQINHMPRRSKMYIGNLTVNFLRPAKPWVAAWWSAALPGFGHMHLGLYIRGFVLLTGEIILNFLGNINLAIIYTFTGQWEKAGDVLVYDYAFLYASLWIFSVYNSYQVAAEMNRHYYLEKSQKTRNFRFDYFGNFEIIYLENRSPWVAFFWSCVFSGFGHLYCQKKILGFILIGWTYAIAVNTHLPLIILYTFTGQFSSIPYVVNYEWLLFFPSLYFFGIYDSYTSVIYSNQLYKEELVNYFKAELGKNKLDIV